MTTNGKKTQDEVSDLIEKVELICADVYGINGGLFSVEYLLKGLVSVLKDERACRLVSAEEFREYYTSKKRGLYLSNLVKSKTNRIWSEEELLDLDSILVSIYGQHDRKPIRLEDKLVLLTKPYICAHHDCQASEDLEIDHRIPVKRGGSSRWSNLQWLCRKHNREKGARIQYL